MSGIKILIILVFGSALSCLSCATLPTHETEYGASFQTVRRMPMGTHSDDIMKKFGKPDLIKEAKNKDVYWIYLMPGYKCCSRVTFRFDQSTKGLESKSFAFMEESDGVLRNFLTYFPKIEFKSARRKQTAHYIPNEIDYVNEEAGVYFTVSDARQTVEDVTWINPQNRELASIMKR